MLKAQNIRILKDSVSIRFVEGKGVMARGAPYTVHTAMGPWVGQFVQWLKSAATPTSGCSSATLGGGCTMGRCASAV